MIDWRNVVAVALGGAFGSSARYLFGIVALRWYGPDLPWGTIVINIAGSLAIGFVGEAAVRHALGASPMLRLFLMVGVLGGFTTFSAFSLEALGLITNRAPAVALGYILASVVLSILACYVGLVMGRVVLPQ